MGRRALTLVQNIGLVCLGVLASACTFDTSSSAFSDPDLPSVADGAPPIFEADASPPAFDADPLSPPCLFELEDGLCELGEPESAITIDADEDFNTDDDPRCQDFAQPGGDEACLLFVDAFSISGGKRFTAVGSRPLVIASPTKIEIKGLLDVSSDTANNQKGAGANNSSCSHESSPQEDIGGAGGGPGGSFAGRGGDGGTGDQDTSLGLNGTGDGGTAGAIVAAPQLLRGGCSGSRGGNEYFGNTGGRGGDSGGAVSLISAVEVKINGGGIIRATGGGGLGGPVQAGGGGGGSGGLVRIKAPIIVIDGRVGASGGSGAEGGVRTQDGDVDGEDGANGEVSADAVAGGAGGAESAGDGGDGSSESVLSGQPGQGADAGAGGGGGGAGFILLRGTRSGSGQTFPAAITTP